MNTDSPQHANNELKKERDSLRLALFEELDIIESLLEPLTGPELDTVRADLADTTKQLEALNESDLASYKLPLLQKEIAKIRKKAEALAATPLLVTKSRLLGQIDNIQDMLKLIKEAEPNSQDAARKKLDEQAVLLKSKIEDAKKQLALLEGNKLASALSSLQDAIAQMREKADSLATRSFLTEEIGVIAKILEPARASLFKHAELDFLRTEIGERRASLESLPDDELSSFRRDIVKLKDRAEAVVIKPGFMARLRSVSVLVWLTTIPVLLLGYMSVMAIWQQGHQDDIRTTATMFASRYPSATLPAPATAAPAVTPMPITSTP